MTDFLTQQYRDTWDIRNGAAHLDEVIKRLNEFLRGHQLIRVTAAPSAPSVAPYVRPDQLRPEIGVHIGSWWNEDCLIIPLRGQDIALRLDPCVYLGVAYWNQVAFTDQSVVTTRVVHATNGRLYEHNVLWRGASLGS
jgi:hypothetical protein